jgi:hypothetical protein
MAFEPSDAARLTRFFLYQMDFEMDVFCSPRRLLYFFSLQSFFVIFAL